jgi:hypothetical protein
MAVPINGTFYGQEKIRNPLNLVQNESPRSLYQIVGMPLGLSPNIEIIQGVVGSIAGKEAANEGAFSRLSCTGNHDHGHRAADPLYRPSQ